MLCTARRCLKSAARVAIDGGRSQGAEAGRSVWSEGRQCYGIYLFRGLENSGVTWNDATLEKWLSDPDVMVPHNNMSLSVPKEETAGFDRLPQARKD
jgi:hypothetical protein